MVTELQARTECAHMIAIDPWGGKKKKKEKKKKKKKKDKKMIEINMEYNFYQIDSKILN